jgi:hypothetical protein
MEKDAWSFGGMITHREITRHSEKSIPIATLPTWTALGMNLDLCAERSALLRSKGKGKAVPA